MCSSYRDLSAHSGGIAGLVLTCRSVLSYRDTESDRKCLGRRSIPSFTVRACHGLSWDSPAGFELSKAVPAVMWQMGIC